jgi:hypothetical protein
MVLAVFTDGATTPRVVRYTNDLATAGMAPVQDP